MSGCAVRFDRPIRVARRPHVTPCLLALQPRAAPARPEDQPPITNFLQAAEPTAEQQQHNAAVQQHRQQQLEADLQQLAQQQQQQAARMLQEAKDLAVAEFWKLVADFVILNPCPARGFDTLPHAHPFMCLDPATNLLQLAPRV